MWIEILLFKLIISENYLNLEKYKQLITENYKEPVNGKYEDATTRILNAMEVTSNKTDEDDDMEDVGEMDNHYVTSD